MKAKASLTETRYKIEGRTVVKLFPSGFYVVRVKGFTFRADVLGNLRKMVSKHLTAIHDAKAVQ
jgi:hypothetical protein